MSRVITFIKMAASIFAATSALLGAVRDNPQLSQGLSDAGQRLKQVANSRNPKLRLDAKLAAIDASAAALTEHFPEADEPREWQRRAAALRTRADLAWNANRGRDRKRAMSAVNGATNELLEAISARLTELTDGAASGGTR